MATYTLTMRFHANGGTIADSPHQSGDNYFKITSNYVYKATSATGTYSYCTNTRTATSGSSGNSKTVYVNLWNVATFNLTRAGYHIDGTKAYRVGSATSTIYVNQDTASTSDTNAATAYRLNSNAYVSANKTVVLYTNWIGNSYTINYNASGGTGTTASSSHVYGTAKALTSNGFTRTGYTFAGWSKSSGSAVSVFYARDTGPFSGELGTDDTYLYIRRGYSGYYTYYRITTDGSDSYTDLGSTAPSGTLRWAGGSGSTRTITCQGNTYYSFADGNDNHDWLNVYRIAGAQTVDYTNGQSITTITKADGTAPSNGDTITLYAVWTPNTYTMHLFTNDGTPTLSGHTSRYDAHDISITTGTSTYSNIGTCSKTGYTFDGWYDIWDRQIWDSNGDYVYSTSTGVWTSGGVFTGDVLAYNYAPFDWTIWAKFTPNTTTLTLNPNGGTLNGSTASTTKTMTYDNTTNMFLGKPTRTGYTFNGWYYGSTQVTDSYGYFIEDTSYWGTSERIAYYSLSNNNTTINGSGNPYNVLITTVDTYIKGLITNNSTIPYIRVSYSDNGAWSVPGGEKNIFWFTIDEFGHKTDWLYAQAYANGYVRIDFDDNIQYFRLHNSLKKPGWKSTSTALTFTANWTPNTYSVYYYANGGTGTMASSSYTYGAGQTLSLNSFVRPGYKFIGWSNGQNKTRVFYVEDVGPYDPDKMGTDGTYVYMRDGTTYYRVTVDNTNQYTNLGTTAPSGVTVWYSKGERMVFNNKDYWFEHTYSEGSGIDKAYIYATVDNPTIAFTDGEVITTHSTLNLYAVWEPTVYIKQNGIWRICIPQVKASGTWETPNHAYVKANGTWKQIY